MYSTRFVVAGSGSGTWRVEAPRHERGRPGRLPPREAHARGRNGPRRRDRDVGRTDRSVCAGSRDYRRDRRYAHRRDRRNRGDRRRSIAMGFGGYLAARTDIDRYTSEYHRETRETEHMPEEERNEVAAVFSEYGIRGAELDSLVEHIASDRERWVDFMMRFELGMEKPDPKRAPLSAATIGGSYALGGLIPLFPYMTMSDVTSALVTSTICTGIALVAFGLFKARFTGVPPLRGALQTLLTGGLAAAAAFGLTRLIH